MKPGDPANIIDVALKIPSKMELKNPNPAQLDS